MVIAGSGGAAGSAPGGGASKRGGCQAGGAPGVSGIAEGRATSSGRSMSVLSWCGVSGRAAGRVVTSSSTLVIGGKGALALRSNADEAAAASGAGASPRGLAAEPGGAPLRVFERRPQRRLGRAQVEPFGDAQVDQRQAEQIDLADQRAGDRPQQQRRRTAPAIAWPSSA